MVNKKKNRFCIFCFAVQPYFGLQLSIASFFARWPSLSIRVELKTGYAPFYNQNSQVIKSASFTNATNAVIVVVVSIHDYVEEINYNDLVKIFPIISKCHK